MPTFKRKHKIKIYLENPPKKGEYIDKLDVEDVFHKTTKYLNTAEACEFLGISNRQIRRYIADKRIPFEKKNKRYRFKVKDLHKWAIEKDWEKGIAGYLNSINKDGESEGEFWFDN